MTFVNFRWGFLLDHLRRLVPTGYQGFAVGAGFADRSALSKAEASGMPKMLNLVTAVERYGVPLYLPARILETGTRHPGVIPEDVVQSLALPHAPHYGSLLDTMQRTLGEDDSSFAARLRWDREVPKSGMRKAMASAVPHLRYLLGLARSLDEPLWSLLYMAENREAMLATQSRTTREAIVSTLREHGPFLRSSELIHHLSDELSNGAVRGMLHWMVKDGSVEHRDFLGEKGYSLPRQKAPAAPAPEEEDFHPTQPRKERAARLLIVGNKVGRQKQRILTALGKDVDWAGLGARSVDAAVERILGGAYYGVLLSRFNKHKVTNNIMASCKMVQVPCLFVPTFGVESMRRHALAIRLEVELKQAERRALQPRA